MSKRVLCLLPRRSSINWTERYFVTGNTGNDWNMFESLILLLIVKWSPNRIFLPHCVFQRKTARTNARTKTTQVKWCRLEYRLWHTPFWHVGFLIKPKTSSLAYLYLSQNLSEVHIFLLVFGYNYNGIISGSTCILPFKITKIRLQMIPKGNTTLIRSISLSFLEIKTIIHSKWFPFIFHLLQTSRIPWQQHLVSSGHPLLSLASSDV